ncbi:MAG: phosphoheptose isomerase, partial [Candidatus Fonsibacter sp.]
MVMKKRVYLIDIDGTVCDDIKNEDSHLYKDVKPYEGSKQEINKLAEEGNTIVFFTAREYKDKGITLSWL